MNPYAMMGMGGLAGALGGAMTPDYQGAANTYQQQMQGLSQGYNPYEKMGRAGYGMAGGLGAQQMLHPAALENKLAGSFTNSPYQNQILSNTSNQMDTNAAQTGMLGSTAQQAALQNSLAGQENQWQQQYVDRGTQQANLGEQQLNRLGMTLGGQGYNAFNTGQQLLAQGDQAQMQAAMMPTASGNMFTDALGGIMGMAGPMASLATAGLL